MGDFGISEGEECFPDDTDIIDFLLASFQCKEGLGCLPVDRSYENFKCGKVTTKLSDKKTCTSDSDCPIDSFCGCNDIDGTIQCLPYPVSAVKAGEAYNELDGSEYKCQDKYPDDKEKRIDCTYSMAAPFYEYAGEHIFPYFSEYRCRDFSLFGAASTVTVSFMAVVAALLFALF